MDAKDAVVGLDWPRVEAHLAEVVDDFEPPVRVQLVHGGRSNLTYRIDDADGVPRWALRRPPRGDVAPTANDIGREHRFTAALGPSGVPVPRAVAWCDDLSVTGAPFALAEWVSGDVIRSAADGRALAPEVAWRSVEGLVSALASIHRVPVTSGPLAAMGRPDGFVGRQVERWSRQWDHVGGRPLVAQTRLRESLRARRPDSGHPAVVHGDFRIDNTIHRPGQPAVIEAVVDWEMATIGDPLTDVGLFLVYWDPASAPVLADGNPVCENPGFGRPADVAELYGAASGRRLDGLPFYVALGCFKLATIAEGIRLRFERGETVGEGYDSVGESVAPLLERGLDELARWT